jgi:hypothetical protein
VAEIKIELTNLAGTGIDPIRQYTGLEVSDPLNDSRTTRLSVPIDDTSGVLAVPLLHGLKVSFGEALVFRGIVLNRVVNYAAGTVDIFAHDPTIKLKHHYHRYGDYAVDFGYPLDGRGMRILVESATPIETQLDRGVPGAHILWGEDTTFQQGPRPTTDPPEESDGIWRRVERGANVWESVINLQQATIGPDFRFRPVDDEHPGINGTPDPYFMVELDTADKLGEDRSNEVRFEHAFGWDNAEEITVETDGDAVRNHWVAVMPGGERFRGDPKRKAQYHNEESWDKYGIYSGWESVGQMDDHNVIVEKAKAWVAAYAEPPDFVTVVPRRDGAGVPQYGRDYFVGDLVQARAKRGLHFLDMTVRIIGVTLRQDDASGNTRAELDCAPAFESPSEETSEEE